MSETGMKLSAPLIYAALTKAMAAVGAVGKTRKNPQQGYQFRGIDDVMAHVQHVLADCGVVCVPRVLEREREMLATKSGGSMASVRLLVAHDFFAADGSSVCCVTLGEAMDSGDKASNKAMSAALKYALTETLMIPTYEAERDTEEASPQLAKSDGPPPDRIALEAMALASAIAGAKSTVALSALTVRLRALPEAERAALRRAYDARLKALYVAPMRQVGEEG